MNWLEANKETVTSKVAQQDSEVVRIRRKEPEYFVPFAPYEGKISAGFLGIGRRVDVKGVFP